MYFTDTAKKTIWQYAFDPKTGSLANKRIFHKFTGKGNPDGLAVDSEGNVFSAAVGVSKFLRQKENLQAELIR